MDSTRINVLPEYVIAIADTGVVGRGMKDSWLLLR